jgi:hypothetical protein
MADNVESKSPLEGVLVKGISNVVLSNYSERPMSFYCQALVIGPGMRCFASPGSLSICDRVVRLYRLPNSIQWERFIQQGEKVAVEPQNPAHARIKIFSSVYDIHAPEGNSLSTAKLDFGRLAGQQWTACEFTAWDYVHQLLKEASKDGA